MRKFSMRRVLNTSAKDLAKYGLYKIISSSQNDLAALSSQDLSNRSGNELFNLSELKMTDKSCDVKSFDKIKAIELMIELAKLEREESENDDSFFKSFMKTCEDMRDKDMGVKEVDALE